MELRFFKCSKCGNVLVKFVDKCDGITCCGEQISELKAGVTDAALEKHVPVVEVKGDVVNVSVGSVTHPMQDDHFINFICIQTNKGFQMKNLSPSDKPEASFVLSKGEKLEATYEYCNLHGLWKA